MFPFKKKKKDEEEEELLDDELPVKKKIRDLNPENKKKRKEPAKPWGKAERVLVLIVLGVTVGVSAIFSLVSNGNLAVQLPDLSGISSGKNFSFGQVLGETFVFEKKGGSANTVSDNKAVSDFKSLTDGLVGEYGFYVISSGNSGTYGLNQDDTFKAASLIKLPTIVALYKQSEEGGINLDDMHTLEPGEKGTGSGFLSSYPNGTKISYRDLAKYMIIQSDNTAFNIIEETLGDRKIQETINFLGMTKTSVSDNITTPKDIATLLQKLENGDILTKADRDEIFSYMSESDFDSWLRAGIPKTVKVVHKYGREIGVVNDGGIIDANNPYVVVIMSKSVDETEADSVFPKLSKAIYDFEVSQ